MKRKIFQVVLVLVLLVITGLTGCAKAQEEIPLPESTKPAEPSLPPELFLDSDGDGFNDWFEMNIAGYDPNIPNDRYFILYYRVMDALEYDPKGTVENTDVHLPAHFLIERGKVPPENIIKLTQEEATASALQDAIAQVAKKSDKNDLVYIQINAHGNLSGVSFHADEWIKYTMLDEWLDQIKAKVLILSLSACGSEKAMPILKKGPSPRIIYLLTSGWVISLSGGKLDVFERVVTCYGNNDNYASLGEIADELDDDHHYQPNWPIVRERRRIYKEGEYIEVTGYRPSNMVDPSNIAYQMFLTDFRYSKEVCSPEKIHEQNEFYSEIAKGNLSPEP